MSTHSGFSSFGGKMDSNVLSPLIHQLRQILLEPHHHVGRLTG